MTAEFYTERAMLALVQHAFLCNLICCFQDQHFCFIIMDLCIGGDLRYLVKNTEPHLHLRQSQVRQRERDRERERQRDTQRITDRDKDREIERPRQTDRQRDRQRQTDRHRQTQTESQIETER
jgi:hypothetical protein